MQILPDVSQWDYKGQDMVRNFHCNLWELKQRCASNVLSRSSAAMLFSNGAPILNNTAQLIKMMCILQQLGICATLQCV